MAASPASWTRRKRNVSAVPANRLGIVGRTGTRRTSPGARRNGGYTLSAQVDEGMPGRRRSTASTHSCAGPCGTLACEQRAGTPACWDDGVGQGVPIETGCPTRAHACRRPYTPTSVRRHLRAPAAAHAGHALVNRTRQSRTPTTAHAGNPSVRTIKRQGGGSPRTQRRVPPLKAQTGRPIGHPVIGRLGHPINRIAEPVSQTTMPDRSTRLINRTNQPD